MRVTSEEWRQGEDIEAPSIMGELDHYNAAHDEEIEEIKRLVLKLPGLGLEIEATIDGLKDKPRAQIIRTRRRLQLYLRRIERSKQQQAGAIQAKNVVFNITSVPEYPSGQKEWPKMDRSSIEAETDKLLAKRAKQLGIEGGDISQKELVRQWVKTEISDYKQVVFDDNNLPESESGFMAWLSMEKKKPSNEQIPIVARAGEFYSRAYGIPLVVDQEGEPKRVHLSSGKIRGRYRFQVSTADRAQERISTKVTLPSFLVGAPA